MTIVERIARAPIVGVVNPHYRGFSSSNAQWNGAILVISVLRHALARKCKLLPPTRMTLPPSFRCRAPAQLVAEPRHRVEFGRRWKFLATHRGKAPFSSSMLTWMASCARRSSIDVSIIRRFRCAATDRDVLRSVRPSRS